MAKVAAEAGSTANRYQILAKLAVGGMAEIFLARGASVAGVERYCVLKRILRERASDAQFVQMFVDEARLAAQLQHPNIASVYDVGMLGDSYFFTMEYVHGETVRSLLQRAQELRRPVPLACVLTIIAGAASGLHHAHERNSNDGRPLGIVHRDVSPSNLMVSFEGNVKVVDFGVAKADDRPVETKSGTVKGKISYLSPEQCRGERVDRRSDLFSLGIVMWELLTGKRLYRRTSDFENMTAIVTEAPPPPSSRRPEVPRAVDDIVLRLLAKSVADRFQTADQVVEAIENASMRAGTILSTSAVSRLVRDLFGVRPEPWLEIESETLPFLPLKLASRSLPKEFGGVLPDPGEVEVELAAVPALSISRLFDDELDEESTSSEFDTIKPQARGPAVESPASSPASAEPPPPRDASAPASPADAVELAQRWSQADVATTAPFTPIAPDVAPPPARTGSAVPVATQAPASAPVAVPRSPSRPVTAPPPSSFPRAASPVAALAKPAAPVDAFPRLPPRTAMPTETTTALDLSTTLPAERISAEPLAAASSTFTQPNAVTLVPTLDLRFDQSMADPPAPAWPPVNVTPPAPFTVAPATRAGSSGPRSVLEHPARYAEPTPVPFAASQIAQSKPVLAASSLTTTEVRVRATRKPRFKPLIAVVILAPVVGAIAAWLSMAAKPSTSRDVTVPVVATMAADLADAGALATNPTAPINASIDALIDAPIPDTSADLGAPHVVPPSPPSPPPGQPAVSPSSPPPAPTVTSPPPPTVTSPDPPRPLHPPANASPPRRPPSSTSPSQHDSARSLSALFDKKDYASVLHACSAANPSADIARVCLLAACYQHNPLQAQRWLPVNPANTRTQRKTQCKQAGLDIDAIKLDCSNDPLDCR